MESTWGSWLRFGIFSKVAKRFLTSKRNIEEESIDANKKQHSEREFSASEINADSTHILNDSETETFSSMNSTKDNTVVDLKNESPSGTINYDNDSQEKPEDKHDQKVLKKKYSFINPYWTQKIAFLSTRK